MQVYKNGISRLAVLLMVISGIKRKSPAFYDRGFSLIKESFRYSTLLTNSKYSSIVRSARVCNVYGCAK